MSLPRPWYPAAPPWQRRLFLLAPLLAIPAGIALDRVWPGAYWFAVREDSAVEWTTFLLYLVAAPLGLSVARALRARGLLLPAALHLLLAVGFLLVAGEEISWGQRQLGFAGPQAIVERNMQQEANLHNLLGRYALHAVYISVGLYGAGLGRVLAPRLPLLRAHPALYAPPAVLWPYFVGVVLYYGWYDYVNPALVALAGPALDLGETARLQEVPELFLALGFLFFLVTIRDGLTGRVTTDEAYPATRGTPGRAPSGTRSP